MTTLYETLGVAKDATATAIKKAFRDKAKSTHPDTGGDPKDFHALVLANDVLSDEEKRRRYDETGTIDDQVDPIESSAATIIAGFVERFMSDDDAKHKDMIGELKKAINADLAAAAKSMQEGKAYEVRALDIRKRVKGKTGGVLIGKMVDAQIQQCRNAVAQIEHAIQVRMRALEMIDDASYDFEAKVEPFAGQDVFVNAQTYAQMMQQASSYRPFGSTTS